LYKSLDLDPSEVACAKWLSSDFLKGGLIQITPADPFEEDKGESRSMVTSIVGTPQLSTPTVEAQMPSASLSSGIDN
jgi:hypothetical protein